MQFNLIDVLPSLAGYMKELVLFPSCGMRIWIDTPCTHWLMGGGTFELYKSEIAGVASCLIACIFTSGLRAAHLGNNLPILYCII